MPIAYNDPELNALLLVELKGVIDEVAKKLFDNLLELIQYEVYDHDEPSYYHRYGYAGGLIGSFEKGDSSILGQSIQSEIDQNPDTMVLDQSMDSPTHGSTYKNIMWDIREDLADIIINGKNSKNGGAHVGKRFGTTGYWNEPRDFFTPFLRMLSDGTADEYIEDAFNKRGILWVKS